MHEGKIVAISGATGGLGPTVVRAFLDAGSRLAVAGRSAETLKTLVDSLPGAAGRCMTTVVDLTEEAATRGWADQVVRKLGRVDVVAHLVGGYRGGSSIAEIQASDWDFLRANLVTTTLNVVRAFVGPLSSNGWGRFLAVTSPRAQAPTAKNALYAMAKSASDALVLAMANELAGSGATANLIMVDSIEVPGADAAAQKKAYGKSTSAAQIAAAMLFLCSDEAATINGVRLPLIGRG